MVTHNQVARTVYFILDSNDEGSTLNVWQPDLELLSAVQLPHDVTRFAHYGTLTALHGTYGGSILSGADIMFTDTRPGPYRFVEGQFKHQGPLDLPDFRGIDPSRIDFSPHRGEVVAACEYRGLICTFHKGSGVFSAIGQHEAGAPHFSRDILGEIYIHPHIKLISVATPQGWVYSTDDTRHWKVLDKGGWPIRLSDTDIPVLRGRVVE
ncbi:hypothetical protein Dxin01_00176 [Deinococcus xinjiangensis]|uniref:Uncharacterized protein n=2 Tax=Deinococcus xinjiangensis TaxID=457454 RepID=A0ABP9V7G1_9DEIO